MQGDFFSRPTSKPEASYRWRELVPGDVPSAVPNGLATSERDAMPTLRTTRDRPPVAPLGFPNPALRRCWVDVMHACGILGSMPHAFTLLTRLTSHCPGHNVEAIEGADRETAVCILHRAARRLAEEQAQTLRALGQHVLARYHGDADKEDRAAMETADRYRLVAKFCGILLALRPLPEPPLGADVALPEVTDFLAALAVSSGVPIGSRPKLVAADTQAHGPGTLPLKREREPFLQAQGEDDAPPRKRRKPHGEPFIRASAKRQADAAPVFADIAATWDEMGEVIALSRSHGMHASRGGAAIASTAPSRTADIADSLESHYKPSVLCRRWTDYASAGFPERHAGTAILVRSILQGIRDEFNYFSDGFNDEVCRVVTELKAHDQVSDLIDLVWDWKNAPDDFPAGREAAAMESLVKWLVLALFR